MAIIFLFNNNVIIMNIYVVQTSKKNIAQVFFKEKKFECFVGKNGIGKKTREGDFITPKGSFKIEKNLFSRGKELI